MRSGAINNMAQSPDHDLADSECVMEVNLYDLCMLKSVCLSEITHIY